MTSTPHVEPNPEKDPRDWVTADEPMTGPQDSYLHTLAQEAGEPLRENMTKAEASLEIERLQQVTGRGHNETRSSTDDAESGSRNVYVTAHGPEEMDTEAVADILAERDLGGLVKSHSYGSNFVTLVVDVGDVADEAAYESVIGKVGAALGSDWTVTATTTGINDPD